MRRNRQSNRHARWPTGLLCVLLSLASTGVFTSAIAQGAAGDEGTTAAEAAANDVAIDSPAPDSEDRPAVEATSGSADGGESAADTAESPETVDGLLAEIFTSGRLALEKKDYATASGWLKIAAEQGHAASQSLLARMYLEGLGLAVNDAEALRWFRAAANQDDRDGQTGLARMYALGRGVAQDAAKAAHWLDLAGDPGDPVGQYLVGKLYLEGRGVDRDPERAAAWFRRSAAQGFKPARESLQDALMARSEEEN